MTRYLVPLVLVGFLSIAAPADAQTIGTFQWRVEPFCSVLNLTVTQLGNVFTLAGFEEQCGGNPRLPVSGVAIVQTNGDIWMGLTTIFDFGNGLHTRATLNSSLSGTWRDNANQSGTFVFNPGAGPFVGGPRITPIVPDALPDAASAAASPAQAGTIESLKSEVADLKKLVAEMLARQR